MSLLAACASDSPDDGPPFGDPSTRATTPAITACGAPRAGDAYTLGKLSLDGHDLLVQVSTGGGCKPHSFAICWDNTVAESYPPMVSLALSHDGHGDLCDASLEFNLRVNLAPVLAQVPAPVHIKITGAQAQLQGTTSSVTVPE